MSSHDTWDALFHPRAVAIVGVSRESGTKSQRWGRGAGFIGLFRKLGFAGRIYPVNPGGGEVMGYRIYPSLTQIPEPVDLCIVTVGAFNVPAVLEDCIAAGVKNVHVFSSGFAETGEAARIELQQRVQELALRGNLRLLGPNCMGVHLPRARISTFYGSVQEPGPVAFVSQSGGHTRDFAAAAPDHGLGISKVVSFGNAVVLDSTDILEYLATDPETSLIGLYVEGVKDGRRFMRVVRELNRAKPVMIWRGGVTEAGGRAVAAHTASLAGNREVWQAVFKHTGAVPVDSMDGLLDVMMTFLHQTRPPGWRAGVVTMGGGQSVVGSDLFAQAGFQVPALSQATMAKLQESLPPVNTSVRNPVDLGQGIGNLAGYRATLEAVLADPSVDFLTAELNMEILCERGRGFLESVVDVVCDVSQSSGKPVTAVLGRWESGTPAHEEKMRLKKRLLAAGVPTYLSLARACRALAATASYREFLARVD